MLRRHLPSLFLLMLLPAACTEVAPVGPRIYAKLPGDWPVMVFTSPADAPARYQEVATIAYPDAGAPATYDITGSLNTIRAKARDFGGNGVIIDAKDPISSGFFAGGTMIRARAIRYGDLLGQSVGPATSPREALVDLDRMRRDGLISEAEYARKRAEILARM